MGITKIIGNPLLSAIVEFIDGELSEYSHFDDRELEFMGSDGEWEYYNLRITIANDEKRSIRPAKLRIKANPKSTEDKPETGKIVQIELGEDSWHDCNPLDSSIKYFWQIILLW